MQVTLIFVAKSRYFVTFNQESCKLATPLHPFYKGLSVPIRSTERSRPEIWVTKDEVISCELFSFDVNKIWQHGMAKSKGSACESC